MTMNFDNIKDAWSTGNKLKDFGIGAVAGLSNLYNRPGSYYVKANYKGGGLADTGLGYIENQNYRNPYDTASLLTQMFSGDNNQNNSNLFSNQTDGGFNFDFFKPSTNFTQNIFNNLKLQDKLNRMFGHGNRWIGTGDFYSNTDDIA